MSRHTIVFGYRSLHLILTLLKTVITWEILHWVPTRRKGKRKKKEEKIGFWSNLNITSPGRQGKGQNLSKLKGTWMVKKKKKKIKHTKKMKRPQEWLCKHNRGACGFGRIAFPFLHQEGRKAGRTGSRVQRVWGAGGGRCYLRCWCCCCKYFAGYQHGLVSMLCVWLHPESREGRGGEREKTKRKRNKWKGEKRNVKGARDITSDVQFPGGRWTPGGGGSSPSQALPGPKRRGTRAGQREASQHP